MAKAGARHDPKRMEAWDIEVGRRIRARRIECRMSQMTLADGLGAELSGVLWTRSRSRAETTAGGETELVWGEENGGTSKPTVEPHVQREIRGVVSPVPYVEVVRQSYAPDSWRSAPV